MQLTQLTQIIRAQLPFLRLFSLHTAKIFKMSFHNLLIGLSAQFTRKKVVEPSNLVRVWRVNCYTHPDRVIHRVK